MSKITDEARAEATRRWPALLPDSEEIVLHRSVLREKVREAFQVGATWAASRPITDEQVEAAAKALFYWDTEDHPEPRPSWLSLSEEQMDIWRSGARAALEAARGVDHGRLESIMADRRVLRTTDELNDFLMEQLSDGQTPVVIADGYRPWIITDNEWGDVLAWSYQVEGEDKSYVRVDQLMLPLEVL